MENTSKQEADLTSMALKGLSAQLHVSSTSSQLEDVVIFRIYELARTVSILNMTDVVQIYPLPAGQRQFPSHLEP